MTVSSTTVKQSYVANGSVNAFTYSFKINSVNEIKVIIRSTTGVETVKQITTHYTVADAGNGGTVTFTQNNTPANGETVVLLRNTNLTQTTDYVENDPFPAESHESALDKLTLQLQEVQEEVDRSIKLSETNTMTNTQFSVGATDRANKTLAFDTAGELTVSQEIGTFRGDWAASTAYVERDLVKDTSTNNIFIVTSGHTSTGSEPLTTNANSAKYSLIVDAASATTSATNAASSATAAANSATAANNSANAASTSENNAATSATTASTQATNAGNSATAAANSASAASTSETNAQTAKNQAEAALDTFDDIFLGDKSSDPSVDNDGNTLQTGALYFNTGDNTFRVYSGSAWQLTTPSVSAQNNINAAVNNATNINAAVANEANITAVGQNISNINAVNSNASNINSAVSNQTNINSVASLATDISTVAGISGDVTSLANSLEKTFVVTVVNVGGVNVFALDGVNNPTLQIIRGNEYIFDVSDSSVSGHPLAFKDGSGNSWTSGVTVTGTAGNAGAKVVFEVPSNAPSSMRYYCTSHGNAMGNTITVSDSAISTVSTNISSVNTTATNINSVNTVASSLAAINAVNSNASNINAVNNNSSNINQVASDATDIGNVSSSISNVNTVATNIANINAVAGGLSGVNTFNDRYRVASSAPTTSLDEGDLYYDTTLNELKVYKNSGWSAAGSTVQGISQRFQYNATSNQTTFSGADVNNDVLTYEAGIVDVYLNGVKLRNGTDVTVTSGNAVVLATGAATGDILDVVTFATFQAGSANASALNTGTVPTARLPVVPTTKGGTGLSSIGSAGEVLKVNTGGNALEFGTINTSSAEVYGFVIGAGNTLQVVTTNGGQDNISAATYATFDEVQFAATGFTFSLSASGNLIATI